MLFDEGTQKILSLVYPDFNFRVKRLINSMNDLHGLKMRVTSGLRTIEEQRSLFAKGRSEPGEVVTWALPGLSAHNFGVAADLCFTGGDPYLEKNDRFEHYWQEFGRLAKSFGLAWGGEFKSLDGKSRPDRPHVQLLYGGNSPERLREIYLEGETQKSGQGLKRVWCLFDRIRGLEPGSEWLKLGEEL